MCSVCCLNPCHTRCPNAREPEPVYRCSICGEGIFEGDKYYRDGGQEICRSCMEGMSAEEVLELFGERLRTA